MSAISELTDKKKIENVISFLKMAAHPFGDRKSSVEFFADAAQWNGDDLVSIPALVQGEDLDAYDKSQILQDLEEMWNYKSPAPDFEVLLKPSVDFDDWNRGRSARRAREAEIMFAALNEEIKRLGLPVRLATERYLIIERTIKISAYIDGDYDIRECVQMLEKIEDAWNERQPEPEVTVFLLPTGRESNVAGTNAVAR